VWCFNLYDSLGSAVRAATCAARSASAQGNVYATSANAATSSASIYATTTADSGLHAARVCGSDSTEYTANATSAEAARGVLHAAKDAGASSAAATNDKLCAEYTATGPNAAETA